MIYCLLECDVWYRGTSILEEHWHPSPTMHSCIPGDSNFQSQLWET